MIENLGEVKEITGKHAVPILNDKVNEEYLKGKRVKNSKDNAADEIGIIYAYRKMESNKMKFRIEFENKAHKTYWAVENCIFVDSVLINGNVSTNRNLKGE